MDAHGGVLGKVGEAVLVDLGGDDAGPGVEGHAVGREVLVGPGHPVAGDGAEDEPGVDGLQVVVAHAPSGQAAGAHGLDHHVGGGGQRLEGGHVLVGAQVHDDAALAPVDVEVHEGDALDDGPGHLADVVAGGRLDLDDLGAQVDERHGDGGRPEGRALEDADPVEGGGAGRWAWARSVSDGLSDHGGHGPARMRPRRSAARPAEGGHVEGPHRVIEGKDHPGPHVRCSSASRRTTVP